MGESGKPIGEVAREPDPSDAVVHPFRPGWDDDSMEVLWRDGGRTFCRLPGDDARSERHAFLPIPSSAEHPTPDSVNRLAHEHELSPYLDGAWALRPTELVRERGHTMLLVDYAGGEPLDRLVRAPLPIGRFLRIAVSLTHAVGQLHRRGLIHKDLKSAHVLVDNATDTVRLTGFGIASRLPRERQSPTPPELIAGTLAYMAPEQTGRVNRSVDSRSDLYSLGVILYEMLTGSLPFSASDAMEWVHCHIARQPAPPCERLKSVPRGLSAIVMRLLSKAAEDRYQTAAGVESDLRRSLSQWEAHSVVDDFDLGGDDRPDRLLIPERLYGREREITTLLEAFDRVVAGGWPQLVLVSGYSGIGKSAVVNELHKALVPPRALFASAKFDQYKRDIPYATLGEAFRGLVQSLLNESEAELSRWRDAFREAVAPNGLLITDLVPELKHVVGEQPPVPELPPADAQRRFHLVMRRFIGMFARPEHPLALFLDDLQWLDAASLDLIEDLLSQRDVRHLLLIGAYRDNEVHAAHPLFRKLDAIRRSGATVDAIVLTPLGRDDLRQMIADSLHCQLEHSDSLAALIHEKTRGNPFFVIQFLVALEEQGLLTFDHGERRWIWDLPGIDAECFTDNVADLMIDKLGRLPPRTQKALQQFACLGNRATFDALRMVASGSSDTLHEDLWDAEHAGLVFRGDDSYRFVHDRVHEAAYALIAIDERPETHLRIGTLLAANTPAAQRDEAIFEIVNQLNRGTHLISSTEERERVADLNRIAGRRAKASTAYESALKYLGVAGDLVGEETWERDYDLVFEIEYLRAECELLTGAMATAEERLTLLARRARNRHDRCAVTRSRLRLYTNWDKSDRGLDVFLDWLRSEGTDWSRHPTREDATREYERIWALLGTRRIEDLVDLPLITDPDVLDTLDVFSDAVTPAFFADEHLASLVVCRLVCLGLEHGNSDASCYGYVWFAFLAGPRFGNYGDGYRFGQVGYDAVEKRGLTRYQARTYLCVGALVMPWTKHPSTGQPLVRRAFDAAYRVGDLAFAGYSWHTSTTLSLATGGPLAEVQEEAEKGLAFAAKAQLGLAHGICGSQLALARCLRGSTSMFGHLDHDEYGEADTERELASDRNLRLVEFFYWVRKLQARVLAGDVAAAVDATMTAERLIWSAAANFETAEFHFYGALAHASAGGSTFGDERRRHMDALTRHHQQLDAWARHNPVTFEHRATLVAAEIARIEGRTVAAEDLYERATRSARTHGFVHDEAIANEWAARFYAVRGSDRIAGFLLREARGCYLRWGADGKVRQLDELYPQLGADRPTSGGAATIRAPVEHLDLALMIRVSEAVSSEIELEKLLDTIMRTALEQAGATRGVLALARGDDHRVEAEATTTGDKVAVILHETPIGAADLPGSVLQYVLRTKESVLLHDASNENRFADEHLRKSGARSVLCLPLLKQARLVGLLYLENRLTPHAFTPARMDVLDLLASSAAISLENTRLYGEISALKDQLLRENLALRDEVERTLMFEEIVGSSKPLKKALSRIAKVAPTDSTVLIMGETGTGKELFARAVHKRSARAGRAFVSVNCAALTPTLIPSELFGHEKGAFTGATQRRLGRFEQAHGATLFLDEVGELPLDTQVALLRILQEREFERVGGTQTIRVDVRIITATNRDLSVEVARGTFREDLFYRLNVFPIEVPPLRDRAEDIFTLVEHFVRRYAARAGKHFRSIDKKTIDSLQAYDWPGNVRELQNVIERSVILSSDEVFVVDESWLSNRAVPRCAPPVAPVGSRDESRSEREIIEAALAASRGRVSGPSGAASKLGVPPSTLDHRIKALGIDKAQFKFR